MLSPCGPNRADEHGGDAHQCAYDAKEPTNTVPSAVTCNRYGHPERRHGVGFELSAARLVRVVEDQPEAFLWHLNDGEREDLSRRRGRCGRLTVVGDRGVKTIALHAAALGAVRLGVRRFLPRPSLRSRWRWIVARRRVGRCRPPAARAGRIRMPTLAFVTDGLVRGGHFQEPCRGLLVAGVAVGVEPERQFAVCVSD